VLRGYVALDGLRSIAPVANVGEVGCNDWAPNGISGDEQSMVRPVSLKDAELAWVGTAAAITIG